MPVLASTGKIAEKVSTSWCATPPAKNDLSIGLLALNPIGSLSTATATA